MFCRSTTFRQHHADRLIVVDDEAPAWMNP